LLQAGCSHLLDDVQVAEVELLAFDQLLHEAQP
jgi:hypothetical protein